MNIGEKIIIELNRNKMKKSELARKSGVAYTTLDSMIKRNPESVNIRVLFKIAEALDVSVDYLARDEITDRNYNSSSDIIYLSKRERKMVNTYLRAKESEREDIKALVSVIDKLLKLDE